MLTFELSGGVRVRACGLTFELSGGVWVSALAAHCLHKGLVVPRL